MAGKIDARLQELGIELPEPLVPAGAYTPFVIADEMIYVSGQLPKGPDGLLTGVVGKDVDIEHGRAAARACALNILAVLKLACDGDLDRITRVVKLTGFVYSAPDFTEQPQVINGASELFAEVFGEIGVHARSAVGVAALPFGVSVEIEAMVEIEDDD